MNQDEITQLEVKLADIDAIKRLVSYEEWELAEAFLLNMIVINQEKLVNCRKEDIDLIRGKIIAYKELLNFPRLVSSQEEETKKHISDLREFEEKRKVYDVIKSKRTLVARS